MGAAVKIREAFQGLRLWLRSTFYRESVSVVPAAANCDETAAPITNVEEGFGLFNAFHINDILDNLPGYFDDLKVLKDFDPDAYDIFSILGGVIPPPASLLSTSVLPEFVENPPAVRCVFFPKKEQSETDMGWGVNHSGAVLYMQRMKGGQVCATRKGCVALPEGLCYSVTLVWNPKAGAWGERFFVVIGDDCSVHLLPEARFETQRLPRSKRRWSAGIGGNGRQSQAGYHFERFSAGIPRWVKEWAIENKRTVEEQVKIVVALALSAKRPTRSILVRASSQNMTGSWTIARNDAKRFFAKRETDLASDGRRKRVLHYVGEFERNVGGQLQSVREHYRGQRSFDWNGYKIEISGMGFHHDDFFDADIQGVEVDAHPKNSDPSMLPMDRASRLIAERYSRPITLTRNRAQRRARKVAERAVND